MSFRSFLPVQQYYQPALVQDSGPVPDATALPLGVEALGGIGTALALGDALTASAGVSAVSAVCTAVAGVAAAGQPLGVAAAGAFGTVAATGTALTVPAGVASTGAIGSSTAGVSGFAVPAGVAASSATGAPALTAAVLVVPDGVAALSAIGPPVQQVDEPLHTVVGRVRPYHLNGWARPEGVQAVARVGTPRVLVSATASARGVAA